jgi:hypothetical protein
MLSAFVGNWDNIKEPEDEGLCAAASKQSCFTVIRGTRLAS